MSDVRCEKLLMIISNLFSAIRGDWSDPRYECRLGWEAVSHLRGLLEIPEEKPYRYEEGRTADQFIERMEKMFGEDHE